MKFDTWQHIYEAHSAKDLTATAEKMADELEKDFGISFYVIPQFEKFTRSEEPTQVGYLLTNDNLRTMRLNFTEDDGELYSVDYWKPDHPEPTITVYLNELPFERAIGKLLSFYKNNLKRNVAVSESDSENVTVSKPVPEKEADKKVIAAQQEYELGDPDEIFSDLETYVNMVLDGEMNSLIVTGQSGVGKTFMITQVMENRGLKRNEDYFKITGKSTPAGMYIAMFEHNGKILMFDDCDSIFRNEDAINVLKGGLDTSKIREINWSSAAPLKTVGKVPVAKKFDFTGKIIFVSNLPRKKVAKALQTRSFVLEVALSKEDMISRMWTLLPKVEIPSGAIIKGAMRNKAMKLLIEASDEFENVELNMRTLLKAIAIVNRIPKENIALRLIKQQCAV